MKFNILVNFNLNIDESFKIFRNTYLYSPFASTKYVLKILQNQ